MATSWRSFRVAAALLATTLLTPVTAQVSTECNPLNVTCPADPALSGRLQQNFTSSRIPGLWTVTNGAIGYDAYKGAAFTVTAKGDAPTLQTNAYFLFGRSEVVMKVAPGPGIISSIVWLSDILDEVDWEFFGSNTTHAETNYFGRGEPDFTNAIYHPMPGGANPIDSYHNYTTTWTAESMDFYIDGEHVRKLTPGDTKNGTHYPQTPMRFSLGIWAAGDPTQPEGTRQWSQGTTDYTKGPFTMWVKSCVVEDYSTGKEYKYGDHSGTWQSIEKVPGTSKALEILQKPPPKSLRDLWNELPAAAHTGIAVAIGSVFIISAIVGLIYCMRKRRQGAKEAQAHEQAVEEERVEMEEIRRSMRLSGVPASVFAAQMAAAKAGGSYLVPPGSSHGSDHLAPPSRDGTPSLPGTPVSFYHQAPPTSGWDPTSSAPGPLLHDDPLSQAQSGDCGYGSGTENHLSPYRDVPSSGGAGDQPVRKVTPGPTGTSSPNDYWLQGR